ncbi:DUF6660 family protein [Flavobacterium sp. DG1-102-2]|uniref:DUF6660 family protein n=1 Tax=Flavobacterium sp. DG1-102-2 TaxID=3081663 RepID=UPI00294A1534|nr:DUF6660 family protein [Flavobacterium sp. DG1-102-2]MDV6170355.1 DUF6660 family protein [Flavobacterium sp. DG1-102-2]
MKKTRQILTAILSVYLLILMVMPCSDAHTQMQRRTETYLSHNDSDQHHDVELCTPFCVCGSCVTAIVLQSTLEFETLHFEPQFQEAQSFYQSVKSTFHGTIWQPPQLA